MSKKIKIHYSIQNGSSVNVLSAGRGIGDNENNKIINNKLNKEYIKMQNLRIPVQELVNAQSKEEKKTLREKLGITKKQLKMIMKDLEQGKGNVDNDFIYVQTEVNTENKQIDLKQKQEQIKVEKQQIQYVQTKKNNNQEQIPPKGKGGWSYKTTTAGVFTNEICGQEEETPKEIISSARTVNIASAIFLLAGALTGALTSAYCLWRDNRK